MTAVNVILRPAAAFLITDGERRYGGQVAQPAPKVLPLPHLNAALATRGDSFMLTTMYGIITGRRATFEDAAANLGQDLAEAVAGLSKALPLIAGCDVVLAGWPETRRGPECWMASDHGRYGIEAFKPASLDGLMMPDDGSLAASLGSLRPLDRTAPFDPVTSAQAIIDAQRQMPGSGVGGFVQLTTILRDSITTKVLHRWAEDA